MKVLKIFFLKKKHFIFCELRTQFVENNNYCEQSINKQSVLQNSDHLENLYN